MTYKVERSVDGLKVSMTHRKAKPICKVCSFQSIHLSDKKYQTNSLQKDLTADIDQFDL